MDNRKTTQNSNTKQLGIRDNNGVSINIQQEDPHLVYTLKAKLNWLKSRGLSLTKEEEIEARKVLRNIHFPRFCKFLEKHTYMDHFVVRFRKDATFTDAYEEYCANRELIEILFPFVMKTLLTFVNQSFYDIGIRTSNTPKGDWHLLNHNFRKRAHCERLLTQQMSNDVYYDDNLTREVDWYKKYYKGDDFPVWVLIKFLESSDIKWIYDNLNSDLLSVTEKKLEVIKSSYIGIIYQIMAKFRNAICHNKNLEAFQTHYYTNVSKVFNSQEANTKTKAKGNLITFAGALYIFKHVALRYNLEDDVKKLHKEIKRLNAKFPNFKWIRIGQ